MVEITQNNFYELLHQNTMLQTAGVKEIDDILIEYPAFHSLYILKAQALKRDSEEKFETSLPKIATNVLDRAQLYDILFDSVSPSVELDENLDVEENEKEDKKTENLVPEINNNQVQYRTDTFIQKEEEKNNLKETSSESDINIKEELVVDQKEQIQEQNEPILENPIETKSETEPSLLSDEKQQIISFVEWLKQKNQKQSNENFEISKTNHADKDVEKIPFDKISQVEADLIKSSANQSKSHLDNFISNQIAKKKNKKRSVHSNIDISIKNNELISETLAEILFLQKKYDEAIDVYEKLSLKYPQKSSYFASRIKKIKKIV